MKNFTVFAGGLLWLISAGCANDRSYEINGSLEGAGNDSVYLVVTHGRQLPADTLRTVAVNGVFTFTGETDSVQNVTLVPGSIQSRKFFSFYLEPGDIRLSGHVDSMDHIRANGTYNNDLQTQVRQAETKTYNEIRALAQQPGNEVRINDLREQLNNNRISFIRQHPDAMVSLMHLYVLQDRVPLDTAIALFARLAPPLKRSFYGRFIDGRLAARERVRIGNPAPLFDALDVNGNPVSLAALKGKYVLLDFWASWCVPCRAENPYVVAAYERYKNKGFTVISVSLDHDRNKWTEAIEKDHLNWTHISELKRFEEPIAQLYGVQPIPDNFLIGPEGKILAAKLRGEELEKTLASFIQ
ncbi:TlpA disulfide reductase family protein [Chitinophaga cymbidii]|nr:TlpA disulfide reductase family protein [Chitinophaga cymbidii]